MSLSNTEFANVCISVEQYLKPPVAEAFASVLKDMLDQATSQYGPRDLSFTVLVVEFGDDHPKLYYPWRSEKGVAIRLSEEAYRWASADDYCYAYWQLAHECIHLLSPMPGKRVSVLEEGIACCFQADYMKARYGYQTAQQYMASFIQAETLMRRLLACDAGIIRKLRQVEPVISQITAALILEQCPAATTELAETLVQRFYRDTPVESNPPTGD